MYALAQIIDHHYARGSAQSAKRRLMQFGQVCVLERNTKSRTAFRLWPSVITNSRVRRYLPLCGSRTMGPVPLVHLSFFSRSGFDHYPGFGRGRSDQLPNEALDAGITPRKTVAVHQILPDGHRVATLGQTGFDDLPVGLTSARRRAAARWLRRFFGLRVGGHLNGRFCRIPSPATWRTHRDSRSPEICPGGHAISAARRGYHADIMAGCLVFRLWNPTE